VEFLLIPNVKLYGELFIDDLFTSRLGSGYFGNKTAFLTGGLWVDAFKIPNLDGRIEYARTRPFIYAHRNPLNSYSHFSTGLGHWIGPNADDFYLRLQYRLSKSLFMAMDFESYRHGANEPGRNVGGDLNQDNFSKTEENFKFLEGIRERRNRFGFEMNYEVFRNFYLSLKFNSASSRNMLLPGGQRGPVSRNEVAFNLSLNR
ncbi:MAG: capsule assembly Wzi family protein, partial [bacterium]